MLNNHHYCNILLLLFFFYQAHINILTKQTDVYTAQIHYLNHHSLFTKTSLTASVVTSKELHYALSELKHLKTIFTEQFCNMSTNGLIF